MSVTKFYVDQEIFITGGSGFIGKALIEKIMRSFPEFSKIYVLLRSKVNKSADERLQILLKDPVFERVRREQPQNFQKIFSIAGDCKELGLGISPDDRKRIENVTMIFHSAASVRFDDNFKDAILLNTRGAFELIKIAEGLKKLKAFIHISTTYSNPDRHVVEEKIYPPLADWRTTIKLAEHYDTKMLNILFAKYSSHQPNTYTFTKHLAEHIVNDHRHKIPILLYRPSIVVSSIFEPVPGWIDNFNGPIGLLIACGLGILRTSHANPNVRADIVPVDVCVQGLILAGYKLGNLIEATREDQLLEVVNCSNALIRTFCFGKIIELGRTIIRKNPLEKCMWLPSGSITDNVIWHYVRLQRRIFMSCQALYKFYTTQWLFLNDNFLALKNVIPPEDFKIYVLMRNKGGKTADQRLRILLKDPVFNRAQEEQPESFKNIFAIAGDCKELGLGISPVDRKRIENVTMIFHSAASVRFDDNFKDAILLNTRGAFELIKIAEGLKKLKAFIHISTTYSNPDRHVVEEKIYPPLADWRTTIKLAEHYDTKMLNILFAKYSSHQPNTYTFTKHLAEQIVNDSRDKIPILLYRPSMVTSSLLEPVPGWLDNFNGPIGLLVACGAGVMMTNYSNPNIKADMVTIDVTVQGLLLAGYKIGNRFEPMTLDKPLDVLHCSRANVKPVTYGALTEAGKRLVRQNPFEKFIWLPCGSVTTNPILHYTRNQRRIAMASQALQTFYTTQWLFSNEKFLELESLISSEDLDKLRLFQYMKAELDTLIWRGIGGCKEFLLREPPNATQSARLRLKFFFFMHYLAQFVGAVLIGRLMYFLYKKLCSTA
uniref:Fatty acyl-CoA reductase n=1 Tax=Glossina palpalis gambiensis TaxID=67801 RepID=A0A1B0ALP3_9MUSC